VEVQQGGLNGATADGASELFTRYSAGIYRYCLKRLRSREEAEDALQATYLNAWRSLKGGFQPNDPRPWLFQIAANVCASNLRAKLGGTRLELRDPEELNELAQVDQPGNEAFLDLTEAVRELPDRQRRALVLRDWHGLAYDEIAAEMAVSDAAVETLIFRARSKVVATLANREWRPKLATSARALLAWPFGFLPAKSALTSGASQFKTGLLVASGTVAPLVTFGVLQVLVFGPEPGEAHRAAARAPVPQMDPPASRLQDGRLPQAVDAHRSEERLAGTRAKPQRHSDRRDKNTHSTGQVPTATPSAPTPASNDPPTAAPHEGQVVLCHGTQSKKRPGVTIHVAPQAAQHGLSKDSPGACG
jgi:RNA polymerase sigma-70 factor (ECF subfamily)